MPRTGPRMTTIAMMTTGTVRSAMARVQRRVGSRARMRNLSHEADRGATESCADDTAPGAPATPILLYGAAGEETREAATFVVGRLLAAPFEGNTVSPWQRRGKRHSGPALIRVTHPRQTGRVRAAAMPAARRSSQW